MLRANPRILGSALFSALGLLPLACGGAFQGQEDGEGGSSGNAAAGSPRGGSGSAGKPTSGGSSNHAGSSSSAGTSSSGGVSHGGTTSGGATSGGVATGGAANAFPCESPTAVGEGYERCANGTIHRPEITTCPSGLPRPQQPMKVAPPVDGQCASDADCADMPHGYCDASGGGQVAGSFCYYGCVEDSECGPGNICLCGEPVGQCVSASCTSDQDCGAGLRCQSYDQSQGCGVLRFSCQSPEDSCGSDADCMGGFCDGSSGSFMCVSGGCVIGRPFLVEGLERVAPLARRSDWAGCVLELDPQAAATEMQQAAQAWARIGQMEHASVAAFARFALQLLQLGAPPELVELATQAMADETRHAKLAFSIASRYGGWPIGPGPLDVERSLEQVSLAEIVRLVVREGCIGETCAALEAREAALHAHAPVLVELLSGIADDEARHAELAWRFVSWALDRAPVEVGAVLGQELASAAESAAPSPSADQQALLAHGIIHEALRTAVRNAALREVIRPCGAALLARAGRPDAENPVLSA